MLLGWTDAASQGDSGALLSQWQRGAPVEARSDDVRQGIYGFTALHLAALHGHADVVALLAGRCGAAVDAVVAGATPDVLYSGWSALQIAAYHGRTAAAVALIKAGARIELSRWPSIERACAGHGGRPL